MDIIQMACEPLLRHDDLAVSSAALEIAAADLRRDAEHEKICAQKDAAYSVLSAKCKVATAEWKRCKEQLATLKLVIFAQSSEKTAKSGTENIGETLSGIVPDNDESKDGVENGIEAGSVTTGQVTDAPNEHHRESEPSDCRTIFPGRSRSTNRHLPAAITAAVRQL
ncbi:hypothetical protein QWZ10_16305 [Paracoccus cavernae]|uniref:Uncharacterized protein n=1 Tax=Paracoccus cavernae TaxID=1571207 RepID=A0ABT8D9C2_9RHOB|nr:hypothetical protein [Paracoccus cavernae]